MTVRLLALVLLINCSLQGAPLDSLLASQRVRAGVRADTLFSSLDRSADFERNDSEFLLAYLPLADLACMTGDDILENVRLARRARDEFAWGAQLTDELYTHFVLPHRVSQEPFVHWRRQFIETLAPRVKNMTMTEAALEVNHWCHEVATYQPSDGRDQDPLTTIRAGLGRCEEEMILAICALRSVGIPARACHTPFWAHQDDNHAWVEVWADGKWYYFGACEPDVALNQAWFTDAARRAMLVVSTAYGDYHGGEPVLKRYGNCTLINSTAVYGTTRRLEIMLLDAQGRPAARQKVFFSLYNYGTFLPCLTLDTDEGGRIDLVCGPGDWFVTAGDGKNALFAHIPGNATQAMLRLGDTRAFRKITEMNYNPPPAASASDKIERDSLFACRLQTEDSLREANMWSTWAQEAGVTPMVEKPDSAWVYAQTRSFLADSSRQQLLEILRKARGNWGNLWKVMFTDYPGEEIRADTPQLRYLSTLSGKDCRDASVEYLENVRGYAPDYRPSKSEKTSAAIPDSIFDAAVLRQRISHEPSRPWRRALRLMLDKHPELDDKSSVQHWLESSITIEDPKDRLGPPLTPAECLSLRRGAQDDLERLYLGFMRVNGVPARFNPVNMQPEIWEDGAWRTVNLRRKEAKARRSVDQKTGKLVIALPASGGTNGGGHQQAGRQLRGSEQLPPQEQSVPDSVLRDPPYNKLWAVARWDNGRFSDLDFGYMQPLSKIFWPQDLPAGLYCITSGLRAPDGSVPVHIRWFEIKSGKSTTVELEF